MAEGVVKKLFFRIDAEGNPFHQSLSRESAPSEVIPLCINGLEGSVEWHRDKQTIERNVLTKDGRNPLDRALLAQTVQNYKNLSKKHPNCKSLSDFPSFAENVLIDGFSSSEVCIGDSFNVKREVDGTAQTVAVIQICNPRRPCYKIKMRHNADICHYSASQGLAALFFRVLVPGSICEGDKITLKQRIHPKWNLQKISELFYSETNLAYKIPRWTGEENEIQEILGLSELGMFRWKEVLLDFVNNREEREREWHAKTQENQKKEGKAAELKAKPNQINLEVLHKESSSSSMPILFWISSAVLFATIMFYVASGI